MQKIFEKIKKINLNNIIKNNKFPYIIIFIFSLLLILPSLFGSFHLGDDQMYHMANIEVYAKELPLSIFAKILPDIGNNLGYGTAIFYPALPHIIGSIILKCGGLIGVGSLATETILHFLIFLLSGITMFWLGQKIFKDNKKALLASLFYITYNYFYVDVIIRDALNESFIFIFMPLVFLGLYNLFIEKNTKMFYIWFIIGYIGMMYSHLVMTVFFTIFLIVFLLFFVKDIFNKKTFLSLCLASIFILIFTSTFTVLMIEHKIFGDYLVFGKRIWTEDSIWNMPFIGYFKSYYYATMNKGLIYSNLNFIVTIFFCLALIRIFRKKVPSENRKFLLAVAVFGILGILLNTFTSIWLHLPSTLLCIQFVWRLSTFVGFGFALVAAEGFESFAGMFKQKYIGMALLIILAFLMYFAIQNNEKLVFNDIQFDESFYENGTPREYFPTSTYKKYKDYYNNRSDDEIIITSGDGNAKILDNEVPDMEFEISDITDKITIELPRFYYLGYKITDKNGNTLDYTEDKYGFITLNITENGKYEVKYTGTLAYQITLVVKSITIIGLIIYFVYRKRKYCHKQ